MFYNEPNSKRELLSGNKGAGPEGRNFTTFDFLREGDIDPALGKKIDVLVENGGDFIVYLDSELNIQYAVSKSYDGLSQYYGQVLNKVAELEGLSDRSFMTKKQIKEYRSMIGAAIARMYEHDTGEVIFGILEKAEYFLKSRVTETARIWYLSSASLMFLLLTIGYSLFYILAERRNDSELLTFTSSILLGAAGAYLSVIMNSKKITVNPSSGRIIHFFESVTRLLIGMIGGFFTALVFSSGMVNIGSPGNRGMTILIFSFVAGFSERMVPNLIHQFESSNGNGKNNSVKTESIQNQINKTNGGSNGAVH